jgi:hypothetical protein
LPNVQPLWASITVLFNFRNVLGHGRVSVRSPINLETPAAPEKTAGGKSMAFVKRAPGFAAAPSGLSVRGIYHGWILRLGSEYFQRKGLADFP